MSSIRRKVKLPLGTRDSADSQSHHETNTPTLVTFDGLKEDFEHFALVFGNLDADVIPVRIHSECVTGDVFMSARCDCGQQLNEAIDWFSESGGVILYLRQEGRGLGLYGKVDAYALQDVGYDTFQANEALGRLPDERSYICAAEMLLALGVDSVILLSNNPQKSDSLNANGVKVVEVKSTGYFLSSHNYEYLKAKIDVTGHTFHISE